MKYNLSTAFNILSWLTDMCAPSPAATVGCTSNDAERISWLERTEPRPWLPADFGTTREGWQLAAAGLIELEHRGPSVLKVRRDKVTATCYPHIRLTDLGARWCRLCLANGAVPAELAFSDLFGAMIREAMARPDDVARVRAQLVQHTPGVAVQYLREFKDRQALTLDGVQWQRSPLFDWAALVLVGKGITSAAGAQPDALAALLRGVPS